MFIAAAVVVLVTGSAALYGWFEAGWLRRRVLDVEIRGLPDELVGLRIAHLSDFHLGARSRGRLATEAAVAWVEERAPDIVCVTGDLVSHPRGEPLLRSLLTRLGRPFVVLGNHDVAITRDPFSRNAELEDLRDAVLLRDETVAVSIRGLRVSIAGVDAERYRPRSDPAGTPNPARLADPAADLRVLLCHYPSVAGRLPEGAYDLILAGHMHGGQIVLPYPGGRITLAHPRAREVEGLFRFPGGTLHVSPGLGTSLIPFRFFARPEVTELVLTAAV
jgi:predicted MPP superfamily phosphohydrolase